MRFSPKRLLRRTALLFLAACALALFVSWRAASQEDRRLTRPVAVHATRFVQRDLLVRGVRLRYVDEGSGPVLVLIPGLTSRIEEYDAMTEEFRADFRVVVFDFPGSGYSDKPDRAYTVAFYVDTLIAALDELKIDRAFLVGGSLGGNIVLRAGARDPERFPRLVAWGPGSAWDPKPGMAWLGRVVGGRALFWPMVSVQSRFWYRNDFTGREKCLHDTFAYYGEVLSPAFVRMYWDLANEQVGDSLFPLAPHITQPTLLLWGDHDTGLDMGKGERRLQQLMPNAKLVTVQAAGHALATERPKETAKLIAEFLREEP